MPNLSVVVLHGGESDGKIVTDTRAAAETVGVSFDSHSGNFEELKDTVENWKILPEILMIQVPEGMDPRDVLNEFSSRFPEGEAEIILYDVPNDIDTYRALKGLGVREVFARQPGPEDIEASLEDVLQTSLARVGIDPRKAVYVFSACGGAGGTSLATSIAKKFSREGRRTLYIDLDLATGPGSFMFNAQSGAKETMGLMEALSNPNRIDALFLERAIDIVDKNLLYLSARRRTSDTPPKSESIPILISRAQQNFDMVVIDVPWRANPEPDIMSVQGTCYIVSPPSPAGLLGFSILAKEISASPARNPLYGVINRQGEFKSNDIEKASFKEAGDIEILPIPYDARSAGRMFFEQKTYMDMSGKIKRAVERVFKTLPAKADETKPAAGARAGVRKKKKRGLFGRK